jgi:hypothetical protein
MKCNSDLWPDVELSAPNIFAILSIFDFRFSMALELFFTLRGLKHLVWYKTKNPFRLTDTLRNNMYIM